MGNKRPNIAWDDSELKEQNKLKDICTKVEVYIQSNQFYQDCILNGNYSIRFTKVFNEIQSIVSPTTESKESKTEDKWISVKDRLPNYNKPTDIAVLDTNQTVWTYYFENTYSWNPEAFKKRYTHWLPLPNPPESKTEEEKK